MMHGQKNIRLSNTGLYFQPPSQATDIELVHENNT